MNQLPDGLTSNLTPGSQVEEISPGTWRLWTPAGPAGRYRLAQIDNYHTRKRGEFPYFPPLTIELQARASHAALPGTWGVGLWNDPFAMGVLSGKGLRLPALPQTAWFFYASSQNYLSLRDDLAANGMTAASFHSQKIGSWLLALSAPALALTLIPAGGRVLRRLGRKVVRQAAAAVPGDSQDWHTYRLQWKSDEVNFWVDDARLLTTSVAPEAPLGLVIWIDNQYAAFPPDGRLRYGMLANPEPAWIELRGLEIRRW